jgi:biopolymer transport protein ExbD
MAGTLAGGRRKTISGINVTPLVDVVLVLLVILMVSSTYIVAQTLKVQLPRSKASDGTAEKPLTVTILKGGVLRLDDQPASEAALTARLKEAFGRDPEMSLVVSADREVHHGDVLDIAKQVGVTKFAINVQQGE